jgi:serine protease inhibitor
MNNEMNEQISDDNNLNMQSNSYQEPINNGDSKPPKKKNKGLIFFLLLLIVAMLVGGYFYLQSKNKVVTEDSTPNEVEPIEYTSPYKITSNNLENFDLKFLQLENKEVNKVYSPLSIKYALAMLYEGSNGDTKRQIEAVIGDYQANKYVNTKNMSFANALFIKNTLEAGVKDDYINNLKNKFNVDIVYDSFNNSTAINNWISNKTLKLVNNTFTDNDLKDLNLALVNTLAIDMNWVKNIQADNEHYDDEYNISYNHENYNDYIDILGETDYFKLKFNNKNTDYSAIQIGASINNYDIISALGEDNIRATITKEYNEWIKENPDCNILLKHTDAISNTSDAVNLFVNDLKSNYGKVDTSTDFEFYIDDNVKVFAKDLKQYNGTTLQYVGIMPTNASLKDYVNNSNAEDLNKLINGLKDVTSNNFESGYVTKITGYIPIFNYDYDLDLMTDLKKLGITDVFDATKANLSGITDNQEYIAKAVHKANIDFSNEGIKAAAITAFGGKGAAGCWFEHLYDVPVKTIDLTFDKPYMYIIRDKNSGEVWFMGTVYEPSTWTAFVETNN